MLLTNAPQTTSHELDGHALTCVDVASIARDAGSVELSVDLGAVRRMTASRTLKQRLVETGQPIYGVTTGFGDSNIRQISPEKTAQLQRNLILYHLTGSGPTAAADVTRATMLIRANCLARGYSGVRPELVQLLVDCLRHDILPLIPERGSVGASGDLVPLCYLGAMLMGEGDVVHQGTRTTAKAALAASGLSPMTLEAKEGLALINGTSFMTAFAVLALADAKELAYAADLCTALTSQVLLGNHAHFDEFLYQQKPHVGLAGSAARIRGLLAGSKLGVADRRGAVWDDPGDGFRELEEPIQDRYSIRCAPHVTGVLWDTITWVESWLAAEINSSTDNPLFDVDAGLVQSGGNFYGGHVGQAMDALKIAVASVGDLLDRQLELVVDEKFNRGLTPNLIPRVDASDWDAGLHHGFKGMQITASALAAEALKLTNPATSFSRSTEAHNQDKVSMGTIAARDARSIVELVGQVAALQVLALCQAADLRGPENLSPTTKAVHAYVRARVPFVDQDRRMDGDISAVVAEILSGALRVVSSS